LASTSPAPRPEIELRVYLPIPELGRQFAAYLGSPLRARGYPPIEGEHALIVEVAPGLAIERIIDLALKQVPDVEPGIHFVERQFGVLEVHSNDPRHVEEAGRAILNGIQARPEDALKPRVLYTDVIEDVTDQHAVIVNRNREASMLLPGQTLLVVEVTPALFAAAGANAAERVAPDLTLVTVSMIGAAGRVYLAGETADIVRARAEIERVLEGVAGRDH
jgi:hypothetical protein